MVFQYQDVVCVVGGLQVYGVYVDVFFGKWYCQLWVWEVQFVVCFEDYYFGFQFKYVCEMFGCQIFKV